MNMIWLKRSTSATLLLLSVSIGLQSCSHKKANLEEDGDPPMTVMEMKAPEEDKTEKWKAEITPKSTTDVKKAVPLNLKLAQADAANAIHPSNLPGEFKFAQSHILLICKDGKEFQNLKPVQSGPAEVSTEAIFPHPGQFVVALQFVTAPHKNHTVTAPFQVGKGGTGIATRKPDADQTKTVDGYEFSLSSYPTRTGEIAMPTYRITKDKRPVSNIEVFNPALPNDAGYAVLISDDCASFVQTVPVTVMAANKLFQQPVMFHTMVEKPGTYTMWAQFKIDGKISTVDFSFKVDPK